MPNPVAFDASTNSRSRSDSVWPRAILATYGQPNRVMMKTTMPTPGLILGPIPVTIRTADRATAIPAIRNDVPFLADCRPRLTTPMARTVNRSGMIHTPEQPSSEVPQATESPIAIRSSGSDKMMSMSREMNVSVLPPWNPAISPSTMPISSESAVPTSDTRSETRAP